GPAQSGEIRTRRGRQQYRPRGGHHVEHPHRLRRAHGRGQRQHLGQPVDLDEQRGVAEREDLHANACSVTPACSSPARTARAISTAPGESPCTQADSAVTATSLPSTAVTTPSATIRTTRVVTDDGSCSSAPG